MAFPRITFGIIVLNGEPFTRYCLRALYPFAHQIVVVEGASRHAAGQATPGGHSIDGTLAALERFRAEDDPQGKVEVVTRDGFWRDKDEQSRAYARRATGDWLWQVDIDEFYLPRDLQAVAGLLERQADITGASFRSIFFWGSPRVRVDGVCLRAGADVFHRLFRWEPGYTYAAHRPPTVLDAQGRNLRAGRWLTAGETARRGFYLYHYAQLFPHQVLRKSAYYESLSAGRRRDRRWAEEAFLRLGRPFHVHNLHRHPSWLEPFAGEHPPAITQMMEDIAAGRVEARTRPMQDVERLLATRWYRTGRGLLKTLGPLYGLFLRAWWARPWWLSRGGWRRARGGHAGGAAGKGGAACG